MHAKLWLKDQFFCGTPHTSCSQGANQAAAASKLGYPTYFVGQVHRGGRGSSAMLLPLTALTAPVLAD